MMDPPFSKRGDLRKAALKGCMPQALPPLGSLNENSESCETDAAPSKPAAASILGGSMAPPMRQPRQLPQAVSWEQYWDRRDEVTLEGRGTFNVYSCGQAGPVVFCVHGGGYTGLTWSLVAAKLKDKYRVVAPDLRGHGLTHTNDDLDFSKETMSMDIVELWLKLYGSSGERVPTLLVGHSMGAALAVWAATSGRITGLDGVVVIDVVEGTALAALPYMVGVLASRPGFFHSEGEAIAWASRSGVCKSKEAAAVSMPSQLRLEKEEVDGMEGQQEMKGPAAGAGAEGGAGKGAGRGRWVWRTPLEKSQPSWVGWYTGLSEEFLKVTTPKMLLLAGTDRLDKELTIGQMQGKFQLALMPTAGHAIQEDEAAKTAEHILQFLQRFRIGMAPMQFPRAPPGTKPVLPVVAGPAAGPHS